MKVICAGCGKPIKIGEFACALQKGEIDDNNEFVRMDFESEYYHDDEDCIQEGGKL